MTVVDEVKDRIDIVEVVGESVKLRKSGKSYTGFCPFHPNKRTPAFAVFPDSGTWRCFGACNEGGDVFSFLMKKEGWDFKETLAYLAERTGVELRPITPEQEAAEEEHVRLRELLETTVTFFRHNLLHTPEGEPVLSYLDSRGMTDATIEAFDLGYAPNTWEATMNHLQERGYSVEDLQNAGLVSKRDEGGYYDRFRNRLMIPIRDVRGRMSGFGARVMDPDAVPKYLNSPQTALFDKGRLLYGLDRARKDIRQKDQAVIVEGYMDVIGLHQAGFANAVSPMGTAITEHQLRLLKRYSRRMILALDADAAGSQATMRGLNLARDALEREADPVFNTRGLVRYEGRLDADIRIVSLPGEKDPDEIVLEDPEAWRDVLGSAQTVVDYVLDVMSAEYDLDDPKNKAQIARQVLPLIEDVADPVEREAYRQQLSRKLKVDERALLKLRPQPQKRAARQPSVDPTPVQEVYLEHETALERFCLGVLLREPELVYQVDRAYVSLELERLSTKDFTGTDRRVIFQAVRSALAQDEVEPDQHWKKALDPSLLPIAEELSGEMDELDFMQPRVREEIIANFLRLRKRNLEISLTNLRFQLQAEQESDAGGEEARKEQILFHTKEVQKIASTKDKLDRALSRRNLSTNLSPGNR
ncbi:MAG: DNA primase [Anaerolineales bacterium]